MLSNCGAGEDSILDCKEIESVHPKGNQLWIFVGRTDAEAEVPTLWLPDVKSQLIEKDSHAGKDWRQEEKMVTEDEMVGWHHRLDGHEFEWTPAVGDGQGGLVCCSPWGLKELNMFEQLNNNKMTKYVKFSSDNPKEEKVWEAGKIILPLVDNDWSCWNVCEIHYVILSIFIYIWISP